MKLVRVRRRLQPGLSLSGSPESAGTHRTPRGSARARLERGHPLLSRGHREERAARALSRAEGGDRGAVEPRPPRRAAAARDPLLRPTGSPASRRPLPARRAYLTA